MQQEFQPLFDLLSSFSARAPLLWALLTLAAVTGASLGLYLVWEVIDRGLHQGRAALRKLLRR
jgi:hypothetical protein